MHAVQQAAHTQHSPQDDLLIATQDWYKAVTMSGARMGATILSGGSAHPVGLGGLEEGLGAYGAGGEAAAFVGGKLGEVHAGVAVHAMACIHPQALPHAAQVAERAVVYRAPRLVVPQMADVTVVPRHCCPTATARPCRRGSSQLSKTLSYMPQIPTLRAYGPSQICLHTRYDASHQVRVHVHPS